MNKRSVVLGLLIAIMSVSALGAGFMGPPTAKLKQGQWSVGYNYMYSDMDLEKTTDEWSGQDPGEVPEFGIDEQRFKDVKTQRHYATIGYGVADWWEVYFQLGIADVKAKGQWLDEDADAWSEWNGLNFDNDFAWGWGTRITFSEQDNISWGTSLQMNWLDTNMTAAGSDDGVTWEDTIDYETYDLLIAVGPTVDMGGWKLYGGPFYYYLSGEFEYNGSAADGEVWNGKSDLEADSNFGGFIGAEFDLAENTDLTTEFSFTGDSWAIGTGITWKF